MNKKIVVVTAIIVFVIVATSLYLLLSPRQAEKREETALQGSETTSPTTPVISETTPTPTATARRECPASGVSLNVYTKLDLVNMQDYSYELSISVTVVNELDEPVKVLKIAIDNATFINTNIFRLTEEGYSDFFEDFYGLTGSFEALVLRAGESRSETFKVRLPDPVLEFWQAGTLHHVTVEYEINGLRCVATTSFTIR